MMKAFLSSLLLLVIPSQAWLQQRQTSKTTFRPKNRATTTLVPRHADKKGNGNGDEASVETDNPCWQNMLDDDCNMGEIYSSSFIAADWIKSMPCGEGIEVSSAVFRIK